MAIYIRKQLKNLEQLITEHRVISGERRHQSVFYLNVT